MATEIQGCYHVARNSMSCFLSDFTHVIKQKPVLSLGLSTGIRIMQEFTIISDSRR